MPGLAERGFVSSSGLESSVASFELDESTARRVHTLISVGLSPQGLHNSHSRTASFLPRTTSLTNSDDSQALPCHTWM